MTYRGYMPTFEAPARPASRYRSMVLLWLPAVLAGMVSVAAATETIGRSPVAPVHEKVLAQRVVSSPVPVVFETPAPPPPPLPEVAPAPIPRSAPRVRTATSGTRTAGPRIAAAAPTKGWIQIPAAGTNAPIVRVGLDNDGNMVTPKNAKDVAWLDNGSFPGPTRNAILAGHRNWKGASGSLMRLEQARPGDVVKIGLDGRTHTFSIVWVRQVHPDNADTEEILGPTPVDSVTIVTCGGNFNRSTRHYEERIVARAELVGIE